MTATPTIVPFQLWHPGAVSKKLKTPQKQEATKVPWVHTQGGEVGSLLAARQWRTQSCEIEVSSVAIPSSSFNLNSRRAQPSLLLVFVTSGFAVLLVVLERSNFGFARLAYYAQVRKNVCVTCNESVFFSMTSIKFAQIVNADIAWSQRQP